jgi:hypothetical protein
VALPLVAANRILGISFPHSRQGFLGGCDVGTGAIAPTTVESELFDNSVSFQGYSWKCYLELVPCMIGSPAMQGSTDEADSLCFGRIVSPVTALQIFGALPYLTYASCFLRSLSTPLSIRIVVMPFADRRSC